MHPSNLMNDEYFKSKGVISVAVISEATMTPSIIIKYMDGEKDMFKCSIDKDIYEINDIVHEKIENHYNVHVRQLKLKNILEKIWQNKK